MKRFYQIDILHNIWTGYVAYVHCLIRTMRMKNKHTCRKKRYTNDGVTVYYTRIKNRSRPSISRILLPFTLSKFHPFVDR